MSVELTHHHELRIKQVFELAELVGIETRNKYQVSDVNHQPILFAAEQSKGILGFLLRQFLGHWRSFFIHFYSQDRKVLFTAKNLFRFYFHRVEVRSGDGTLLGAVQRRFSILSKKFDVQDERGKVLMSVNSPIFRLWTFRFIKMNREAALVEKKWSGVLTEVFSDKDQFQITFKDNSLSETERRLVLAATLFLDLQYFEGNNAAISSPLDLLSS